MKGQINLEFLASAMLYLLALGAVVAASSAVLPSFSQETQKAGLNLEGRSTTFKLLTEQGSHSSGAGGTDWEFNNTTRANAESLGLSTGNDFEIARDKINALRTVGEDYFNYTQFRKIADVENQYRFNFTWFPVVQTEEGFTKCESPNFITEPEGCQPDENTPYSTADNRVMYGSTELGNQDYHFLITARNGVFNATYISSSWDFSNQVPKGQNQNVDVYGIEYNIESFQNREDDRGSIIILSEHLKTFGAAVGDASPVISFNRYGYLEGEPLRISVQVW